MHFRQLTTQRGCLRFIKSSRTSFYIRFLLKRYHLENVVSVKDYLAFNGNLQLFLLKLLKNTMIVSKKWNSFLSDDPLGEFKKENVNTIPRLCGKCSKTLLKATQNCDELNYYR